MKTPEKIVTDSDVEDKSPVSVEPLRGWERSLAIIIGGATVISGGYAVFVSVNQVGTAVLLAMSAIFLLIGIQGTPLVRFTSGANSVEMERRALNVKRALKEAEEEDNVDRAAGIVEGITIAEPTLVPPEYAFQIYVRRLTVIIMEMGYYVTDRTRDNLGADLIVQDKHKRVVAVEVKNLPAGRSLPRTAIDELAAVAARSVAPILLVSNVRLSREAQLTLKDKERLAAVVWRDDADDPRLSDALKHLFDKLPIEQ